jgi:hypothetical protein
MNFYLFVVPIAGALIGWLMSMLGVRLFLHNLAARKSALDRKLSEVIANRFFSMDDIEHKLSSPESFQKLLPVIEGHIDEFLNHKLPKAMPMLGMFVGEKTIKQLKDLFMAELATLFPVVMKNYVGNLKQDANPQLLIYNKLSAINPVEVKSAFRQLLGRHLGLVQWYGALSGLMISLVNIGLIELITRTA